MSVVAPDLAPGPFTSLPVVAAHSDGWHEQRASGLGGSDASTILGLNPWRSAYDLWLEKTGRSSRSASSVSEAAYWGTVLEHPVADRLEDVLRAEVSDDLFLTRSDRTLRSTEHPWMLANLDRWVHETGDLAPSAFAEVKTVGLRQAADWAEPDGVGIHALIQCQHYMVVTGMDHCYVAVLVAGQEFRWRLLERHAAIAGQLIEAEAEFWQRVQDDEPPAPDGSESATRAVLAHYPQATAEGIDVGSDPDVLALIGARQQIAGDLRDLQVQRDEVDNRLKAALGEAEAALIDGKPVVRWTNVTSKRLDTKALRQAHPDLADEFTNESTTRRFWVA